MAETRRKFVAAVALAAGLSAGGVAGFVLGVPGVSNAQTTTTVPNAPSTTAPAAPGDGATNPDRPERGSRENCPDKDGDGATEGSGTGGAATNTGLRRGGGRV